MGMNLTESEAAMRITRRILDDLPPAGTPGRDQLAADVAALAEGAYRRLQAGVSGEEVRCRFAAPASEAQPTVADDPTTAILAIAREHGVAVAYLNRAWFEDYLSDELNNAGLTDQQWERVEPHLQTYDQYVCETADLNYDFVQCVLAKAGIKIATEAAHKQTLFDIVKS